MHRKLSHDQFAIEGDRLTHRPTGTQFWIGENDVVLCDAGDLQSGAKRSDYDLETLKASAWEILVQEKARCV